MSARAARVVGVGLGLAVGVGAALYHRYVRRPLPRLEGQLVLGGLANPVEVLWDRWGVPHIYAQSFMDLFFMQGYLHAQDRLWQMDLNRRVASGRLSEIFGERGLEMDRFMRRVGLHRAAAAEAKLLDGEAADMQIAYCGGINAFLHTHRDRLPLEFTILRYRPEPWTPADTVMWTKMMAWTLANNWDIELFRAQALAVLGPAKLAKLERRYPAGHPISVPPGDTEPLSDEGMKHVWEEVAGILGGGMSNAWAVDGTRTASGKPLLANDPHLFPQLPSAWYEVHLESPDVRAAGASLPGNPGVVIGHNEHVAWGATAGMADTQDVYIERFAPGHRQYASEQGMLDAEVLHESIVVKGRTAPVVEEVSVTRHGPVILWSKADSAQGYALRSVLLEPSHITRAGIGLLRATDWSSWREALRDWSAPAVSMVYADVLGNIGYQLVGWLPRRKPGTGVTPSLGWTGEQEWDGWLSLDDAPHAFNPEAHHVENANNKAGHESPDALIIGEWADGFRAMRIGEMLTAKRRLTVADMKAMHADDLSLPAAEVKRLLAQVQLESPWACWAQNQIKQWDGRMSVDSRGAAIYQAFRQRLFRRLLEPLLGDYLQTYLGTQVHPMGRTSTIATKGSSMFLERLEDLVAGRPVEGVGDATEVIVQALEDGVADIRMRLGNDSSRWTWGNLHQGSFKHVLGQKGLMAWFLNRGPFPIRGDSDTIHQASFSVADPFSASRWMPSYRFIADTSDWDKCVSVHAPGQSGQVTSPHYDDQLSMWHAVEYHPMPFSRPAVEEITKSRQHFLPRSSNLHLTT